MSGPVHSFETYALRFCSQVDKAPWLAAWDRQARMLLRLEMRSGAVQGPSILADVFDSAADGEEELGAVRLEEVRTFPICRLGLRMSCYVCFGPQAGVVLLCS